MANDQIRITRDLKAPTSGGIHYRLMCMTGENKGISYYLKGTRFVMGRSDKADIQVLDSKCSREHAELILVKDQYVITDLSSNGVVINDLSIKQHTLVDGDRVIIGATVFKYNYYEIQESDLVATDNDENNLPSNLDKDASSLVNDEAKTDEKRPSKKKLIYGVVALIVLYLFLDDGGDTVSKKKKKKKYESQIDDQFTMLLKKKIEIEDAEHTKKLNVIIGSGLREMREKNYFRAIEEFEVARILSPSNGTVSYYISKAKQYLDEDIEQHFLKARRESDALKYRDSKIAYCAIMQLLRDYPEDKRYKKAVEEIYQLEKKMGLLKGEIVCLREYEK